MEVLSVIVVLALLGAIYFIAKPKKVQEEIEEIIDEIEEVVEEVKQKIPSEDELKKLTKAKLDEFANELGIKLDRRKTKAKMIEDLKKELK